MGGAREENARLVRLAITEAVLAQMNQGVIPEKMTVVAVAAAAGVSRVSFYRYYDRVTDVLPRYLEESARECLDGKPWSMGLRQLFEEWGGIGRAADACVAAGQETLLYLILNRCLSVEEADFRASALAGAFAGILVMWVKSGRQVSAGSALAPLRQMV